MGRKRDSNIVKDIKKLEKMVNNIDFSRIRFESELTELQKIVLSAYEHIEEVLLETFLDYEKLLHSLNIQVIVDDE